MKWMFPKTTKMKPVFINFIHISIVLSLSVWENGPVFGI